MRRALAVIALVVAGSGCASASVPRSEDRTDLMRRILASMVQIRSTREAGVQRAASGVVVATDWRSRRVWIITAKHFIHPPSQQELYVRLPGRDDVSPAKVAFVNRDQDLVVLEAEDLDVSPVRLKDTATLSQEIIVVAFPWGQRFTVVRGVVSQIIAPDSQLAVTGPVRMVSASVSYGSSGGGVFDGQTGELIGIVEGYRTAKVAIPEMKERVLEVPVPGETLVIPTPTILRFLEASGLGSFLPK